MYVCMNGVTIFERAFRSLVSILTVGQTGRDADSVVCGDSDVFDNF